MAGSSRSSAVKLTKGNCFIFPPHTMMYYRADETDPWIYRWLAFSAGPGKKVMALPGTSGPTLIDTEPADGILPLFRELETLFDHPDREQPVKDEQIFLQMLSILINKIRFEREDIYSSMSFHRKDGKPDYVKAAREYIKDNFQNPINCSRIADHIGLERSYLSRIFREQEGQTLKEYLTDVRMKEAMHLLRNSDFSIEAVAKSVGYREYKGFARNFKREYGCSAGDVQRRYRY